MENSRDFTSIVNNIKMLCVDMIDSAQSGHPGMPMGCAPILFTLFTQVMRHSSNDSNWIARDRFVLSNGHGCSLLYVMLHLCKYNISADDLRQFRKLNSKTPGHPERGVTDGCEVTTGPLGQGIANAVGMAISQKHYEAKFGELLKSKVYTMCGDGCLMEGISYEAMSLAGHLKLDNLVILYDDNEITIDGNTNLTFTENIEQRCNSAGWAYVTTSCTDPYNIKKLLSLNVGKPLLIAFKTVIGTGSLLEGSSKVHGAPLKPDDIAQLREKWNIHEKFEVLTETAQYFEESNLLRQNDLVEWNQNFNIFKETSPEVFTSLEYYLNNKFDNITFPEYVPGTKNMAPREMSQSCLSAITDTCPNVLWGSADLTPSNLANTSTAVDFTKDNYAGRYIRYGIREHAMCAIANGIHAFGGCLPIVATFLNFIEYGFPAVRLSALSKHRVIYVMTHDSIGLGEDGPTHQPIEALALCRCTPNLLTFRPADGNEVNGAYECALKHNGPSVIALSRQKVLNLENSSSDKVKHGAYIVNVAENSDVVLVSTGTELELCLEIAKHSEYSVRVVSMPCAELFDIQSDQYKKQLLPKNIPVISVEAGSTGTWHKYATHCVSIDTFGASGKGNELYEHFGFTKESINELIVSAIEEYSN